MLSPENRMSETEDTYKIETDVRFDEISHVLEEDTTIWKTEAEILKYLEQNYVPQEDHKKIAKVNKRVLDKCLIELDGLYGNTLVKALRLVETNSVRFYHTKSKDIGVYQILPKSDFSYILFPYINHCYCPSFKKHVPTGSHISCKHVLAAKLAKILGRVRYIEIAATQLHELVLYTAGVDEFNSTKMNNSEEGSDKNQFMKPCVYPQLEVQPGFPQPNNWAHVLPQAMPWRLRPNLHPSVVRFTAGDYFSRTHHPIKRKMNVTFDLLPTKQFVTDEKMAAHMSNLHISDFKSQCLNPDDEPMDTDRLPRLFICDKVKNLKTEPIIPESLLNEVERPKMAVVLWQPPGNDLVSRLIELEKDNDEKEKEKKDEDEGNSMIIENNNVNNIFRPIDPVPMHSVSDDQFLQPTPQLQPDFSLFSFK